MPDRNPIWLAERAIVLQVLRDDHDPRWARAELEHAASDLAPQAVHAALVRLEAEGAIITAGEHIIASRCARHLDALGLVTI